MLVSDQWKISSLRKGGLFMLRSSQFGWVEGESKKWEDGNMKSERLSQYSNLETKLAILEHSFYLTISTIATLILARDHVIFKVSWSDQFWKWVLKLKWQVLYKDQLFLQVQMLKSHINRVHSDHGLCKSCLILHSEFSKCNQCDYGHLCPQVVKKHTGAGKIFLKL